MNSNQAHYNPVYHHVPSGRVVDDEEHTAVLNMSAMLVRLRIVEWETMMRVMNQYKRIFV
jgi:hypothetical protein